MNADAKAFLKETATAMATNLMLLVCVADHAKPTPTTTAFVTTSTHVSGQSLHVATDLAPSMMWAPTS